MAVFEACVDFTLRPENEGNYVDNPADPGGPTNFGITLDGLSEWRGHACTAADVRQLTLAEARQIYQARYWQAVAGANLPPGLDLMVFDFGVNHGPGSAVKMLQRLVGAKPDGAAGPNTIKRAACQGIVLRARIAALASAQQAFYASLKNQTFGKGWAARTTRREAAALQMAPSISKKTAPTEPAHAQPARPQPSETATEPVAASA